MRLTGEAVLAADLSDRIKLDDGRSAKIVKIVQDKGPLKAHSAHQGPLSQI
jgi:hypothetical protein